MKALIKFLLIINLYCLAVMPAKADPLDSLQHRELVQRGVAALRQVLAQNVWNNAHGISENNKYVVRLDTTYIRQRADSKGGGKLLKEEFISAATEKIVNDSLKKVNHASGNAREFGVYVMVFNSYIVNLTKLVTDKDSVRDLMALKKFAEPAAIDVIDKEINDLNNEIWDQVGFTQNDFAVRVGIVYGREVLLYNRKVSRVLAVTQALGTGISSQKLKILNANLKDVKSLGDPLGYLTTYPAALYKAYRAKTIPVKLKNKFTPSLNTYFSELSDKAPKEYKEDNNDPRPPASRGVPVIDYSHGVKPEDMKKILEGINSTANETGYQPKIFITSYVTPDEILQQVKDYLEKPAGNKEIVIWVHIDADKSIQYEYGYGKDVPQQNDISAFAALLSKVLPELHGNPLADMFDALAGLIGQLKIPPKYYNPDDPKYNPLPGLVVSITTGVVTAGPLAPVLLAIMHEQKDDKYSMIRMHFAFTAGLWNGCVEILEGAANTLNMLSGGEQWTQMKEGFSKLKELYNDEEKGGVKGILGLVGNMIKEAHTGNPCEVSHTIAKDIINIASFYFAFAKVGAAAEIGKLLDALDPLTYVMKGAGKLASYSFKLTGKFAGIAAKGFYRAGKWVVTATIEDGKLIIKRLDELSGKLLPIIMPSRANGFELALLDGRRVRFDRYAEGLDADAVRMANAIPDEGDAARAANSPLLVELTTPSGTQLAVGHVLESIEELRKKLASYPKLLEKLKDLGEDGERAFIEEFGDNKEMLELFTKNGNNFKLNVGNWHAARPLIDGLAGAYPNLFNRIKAMHPEYQIRFAEYYLESAEKATLEFLEKGDAALMDTWRAMAKSPEVARVLENLKSMHSLLSHPNASKLEFNLEALENIIAARMSAGTNVTDFGEFAKDLTSFVEHYANVKNAKSVIANLGKKQLGGIGFIGEEFIVYLLNRSEKMPFKMAEVIEFQFDTQMDRIIDIVTSEGSYKIFNELKSVKDISADNMVQFLKDLKITADLKNVRWLIKSKEGGFAGPNAMKDLKDAVMYQLKNATIPKEIIEKFAPVSRKRKDVIKLISDNFESIFHLID